MSKSDSSGDAVAEIRATISSVESLRRSPVRAAGELVTRIPRTRAARATLRALPTLTVGVTDTLAGEDIAAAYAGRERWRIPRRSAVAVLDLPEDPALYLRGRSRQAVRTNCARARAEGMTYRRPESKAQAAEMIETMTAGRPNGARESEWMLRRLANDDLTFRFVADASGQSIAHLHYTVDGKFARLNWGISAKDSSSSPARYLVSAELFLELAATGTRHILTNSELITGDGVRYFQRRLGFEPRNLEIVSAAPPRDAAARAATPHLSADPLTPMDDGDARQAAAPAAR